MLIVRNSTRPLRSITTRGSSHPAQAPWRAPRLPRISCVRGSQFRTGIPPQAALGGDGGGGSVGPRYLGGDGGDGDNNGNGPPAWLAVFASVLCAGMVSAGPAYALGLRKKKKASTSPDIDRLVDLSWPILKNLGFSGVLGVIAGVCLKTVGRSLAVVVGIIFAIVQVGAYFGYVKVDWARVHKDVIRSLDVNKDGKFDATDLKALLASLLAILSQGVPSLGGFCAGFSYGLRW